MRKPMPYYVFATDGTKLDGPMTMAEIEAKYELPKNYGYVAAERVKIRKKFFISKKEDFKPMELL